MSLRNGFVSLLLIAAASMVTPPALSQTFDPSDEAEDSYVQGNLLFLTYHETGHLLMDAVLGADQRQDRLGSEEIADDIATWLMLPDPEELDQDEEILAAMEGWLDSADVADAVSGNPHYPDDAERAARIACYLYGSNPGLYPQLAHLFRVSIQSADCPAEYEQLRADLEDWFGEHMIPPAQTGGGRVTVSYADAGPGQAEARRYLMQTGILKDAANDVSQFIRLPGDIRFTARSCGGGAAEFRYNPTTRDITACYEAVSWFMGHAAEEVGERATAGDDLGSGGARVKQRPRPRPRPR